MTGQFMTFAMLLLIGIAATFKSELGFFADANDKIAIVNAQKSLMARLHGLVRHPWVVRASMDHALNKGRFCDWAAPKDFRQDLVPTEGNWSFPRIFGECAFPEFTQFFLVDPRDRKSVLAGTTDQPVLYSLKGQRCEPGQTRGCPFAVSIEYRQMCEAARCGSDSALEFQVRIRHRDGATLARFGEGFKLPEIVTAEAERPRISTMQIFSLSSYGILCAEPYRMLVNDGSEGLDTSEPVKFGVASGPGGSAEPFGDPRTDPEWGVRCLPPYQLFSCTAVSNQTRMEEENDTDTVVRGQACMTRYNSFNRKVTALCCNVERTYR